MTKKELNTEQYFDLIIDIASFVANEGAGQLLVDLKHAYPEAYQQLKEGFDESKRKIPALMKEPYGHHNYLSNADTM
jgi:hypothetical protein